MRFTLIGLLFFTLFTNSACVSTATIPSAWGSINGKQISSAKDLSGTYKNTCELAHTSGTQSYEGSLSTRLGAPESDEPQVRQVQLSKSTDNEINAIFLDNSRKKINETTIKGQTQDGWFLLSSTTSPHANLSGAVGVGTLTTGLSLRIANDGSLIIRVDESQNMLSIIPPVPVHISSGSYLRCQRAQQPAVKAKQ